MKAYTLAAILGALPPGLASGARTRARAAVSSTSRAPPPTETSAALTPYAVDNDVSWSNLILFNSSCGQIGHTTDFTQGTAVTSELQYTVIIDQLPYHVDDNRVKMRYGAYLWGSGKDESSIDCEFSYNNNAKLYNKNCIHAFPCDADQ